MVLGCARQGHARGAVVTEEQLIKEHGIWGEFAEFPPRDWMYEVANGDTRLGYWAWVKNKIEEKGSEP